MTNISETIKAKTSAKVIDHHIPSIPKISGSMITDANWKTKVLKNETIAEMTPLFNAVKKDEINILNPAKIKTKENK